MLDANSPRQLDRNPESPFAKTSTGRAAATFRIAIGVFAVCSLFPFPLILRLEELELEIDAGADR